MANNHLRPFFIFSMSKASKLISEAILGNDYAMVYVTKQAYAIQPPTIKRLAGAISCISDIDLSEGSSIKDMLLSAKESEAYAKALSWLIAGDLSKTKELCNGTLEEVVDALSAGFDLVGIAPFLKAVSLTKNASQLAAIPK